MSRGVGGLALRGVEGPPAAQEGVGAFLVLEAMAGAFRLGGWVGPQPPFPGGRWSHPLKQVVRVLRA